MEDRAVPRHTNRLIHETSPYLLQHAHNPVDWYPWGEEALASQSPQFDNWFILDYASHIKEAMEDMRMKAVAVSELKASLSRFLAAVKGGEEVIVTDRGKPVAKLVPVTRDETAWPPHLLALERAGMAKIGTGGLPHKFWDLPRPKDPRNRALKSLLKERAESW